jgi:pyruvate/2-oxoglutarate/acetoin dehydrogenase E1 component
MSTQIEARPASAAAATVEMTYRDAITIALGDAMDADPSVLLMGEDVGAEGGVFKTNTGLVERFGPKRVATRRSARTGSSASPSG